MGMELEVYDISQWEVSQSMGVVLEVFGECQESQTTKFTSVPIASVCMSCLQNPCVQ